MPLPLIVSCSSKIQIGFNLMVPVYVVPDEVPLTGVLRVRFAAIA